MSPTSTSPIAERIGKLLRKAEATTSTAEAEALYAKAQALATAHAIDLAVARHRAGAREQREVVEERSVVLATRGQAYRPEYLRLFTVIATANDVQLLVSGDQTQVFPMGLPSDLDTVEQLYFSVAPFMVRASTAYLATGEHRVLGVHGQVARRSFFAGFTERVAARLDRARAEAVDDAERRDGAAREQSADDGGAVSVTTLALRDKQREVGDFYAAKVARLTAERRLGRARAPRSRQWSIHADSAGYDAGGAAPLSGRRSLGSG